ncbi:general substrate transporter [Anaeromyces robustus]|jgi:sugar porter (SP) family MFS transporter|uniref:General substrate transporter n=1 Tax=Anaeromyces robustus TaxID=1754192 RepID=A0A1Y1XCU1_9FUNG|nr:general substrate transporter [Anaeromyces robustus]|eukprot:ORX83590.1 general substrate transporter [Anaeromyces robustus]
MFKINNPYMIFVAFVASLGGFQFGYEVGILDSFQEVPAFRLTFPILYDKVLESSDNPKNEDTIKFLYKSNEKYISLITSLFCIGCAFGACVVPRICDFFGRKRSIIFGAAIFGLGSLFSGVIENFFLFLFIRFIMGTGIGILSTICPLYIAETAPAESRGKLITLYQFMITVGIFSAYTVKMIIEHILRNDPNTQWRVILGLQVIPGFILLVMMFFLPYSPRYYIWQEREDEALRIVSKLRSMSSTRDPEIQSEFQSMKTSLEFEKHEYSSGWKEIFSNKSILKRVLLGMLLQIFQQYTGINIMLNSHKDISNDFFKNDKNNIQGLINVVINVIFTIPTFYLIEKWGRKVLLILGSIGMSLVLAIGAGADYLLEKRTYKDYENIFKTTSMSCVFAFIGCFAISWGPVVWVYQSEIFPMRIRSKATALSSMSNWLSFALIITLYPFLSKNNGEGVYLVNFIFSAFCFVSLIFVIFFVKETKGIPLEDIEVVFLKDKELEQEKPKQK